jgi:hypothetical protein
MTHWWFGPLVFIVLSLPFFAVWLPVVSFIARAFGIRIPALFWPEKNLGLRLED